MIVEMRDFSFFVGWRSLLQTLVDDVNAASGPHKFRCVELKEKFGGCRIIFAPIGDVPDDIVKRVHALTDRAELASEKICMKCGRDGRNFEWDAMWISTLCKEHAREAILKYRTFPQGDGWCVTAEFQLADSAGTLLAAEKIAALDARAASEEFEKDGTFYGSRFANTWYAARLVSL